MRGAVPLGRAMVTRDIYEAAMREATRKITSQLDMEDAKFRSVYLPVVRDHEPRVLDVFDFADSSTVIGTRETSNTANQALFMMNNPFVIQQSEAFADRLLENADEPSERIRLAFILAYGRPPTDHENLAANSFVNRFESASEDQSKQREALSALCQSLFASAEFRYLD